jgi:hypothetical protein
MQRIELTGLEQETLSGFLAELLDSDGIDAGVLEILDGILAKVDSMDNWTEED